jgi:hypothetical protein
MKIKDLKINFRYLGGNIACLSVDSIDGEAVHNDINNEEAIIIFNSLVGEKENCQTVKTLLKENQELKKQLENCYCNRTDCSGRIKDSKVYDSLVQKVETQQKEFIKYLEDEIERKRLNATCTTEYNDYVIPLRVILQKFKEIIGVSNDY